MAFPAAGSIDYDKLASKVASALSKLATPSEGGTEQVIVGTTAVQLPNISCRSVIVKADDDNSGDVYIGFSDKVSTSNGFRLKAGQGIELAIDNLSKIWLVATADNQKVHILWVR